MNQETPREFQGLSRPCVSIIVISRDDPRGLIETLTSIQAQSYRDYEVIVVAKGESEVVDVEAMRFVHAAKVQQEGVGISEAFNLGLSRVQGRWVNFLNGGDCYWDRDSLGHLVKAAGESGCCMATARAMDIKNQVLIPRGSTFARRNVELVSHQATLFNRDLFDQYGTFSRAFRIRMDFEWMLRLPSRLPVVWLDQVVVRFDGTGISAIRPWMSCGEELRALHLHAKPVGRILSLLFLYLPWRLVRARWRAAFSYRGVER